jgi:hypothetical protein
MNGSVFLPLLFGLPGIKKTFPLSSSSNDRRICIGTNGDKSRRKEAKPSEALFYLSLSFENKDCAYLFIVYLVNSTRKGHEPDEFFRIT